MHLGNRKGQQARKGARKDSSTEEQRHAPLNLVAFVVHADKIDTARDDSSFEEAEKCTTSDKTGYVFDEPHADS
jgi:hypothetical protein